MQQVIATVIADVGLVVSQGTVRVKQGDSKSRAINIVLRSNGSKYTIAEGCAAKLHGKPSEDTDVLIDCDVIGEDTIQAILTPAMVDVVGATEYEAQIYGADGERLSTAKITVDVIASNDISGVTASDDFQTLTNMISQFGTVQELTVRSEAAKDGAEAQANLAKGYADDASASKDDAAQSAKEAADSAREADSAKQEVQAAIDTKVDKVSGKGLSTNDYTTAEKNKLAGVETGANRTVVDSTLSAESANPVQNKAVQAALDSKVNAQAGKGLSTNDYTTAEKQKLSGIAEGATKTIVDAALSATSTNPVQNKVINAALNGFSFASMTQDEYDALTEKDANTLYIVTPGGAS